MIFTDDVIDTRYVFGKEADRYRGWTVQGVLTADPGADPHTDGEWATPEDIDAWEAGRWQYVTVWSVVALDGVEIVREAISAVVHGDGPEDDRDPLSSLWEADAFDLGNALGDVTLEAVREVSQWLTKSIGVEPSASTFAVVLEWAEIIRATLQGQADAS